LVHAQLERIATFTGTDIFVLKPEESKASAIGDPEVDASQSKRLKVKIYGDYESVEHAKTRVLIMIDDMVCLSWLSVEREFSDFFLAWSTCSSDVPRSIHALLT
jgi:hypothetical protein